MSLNDPWERDERFEAEVRAIVRDEIAQLAGLALRRTQDQEFSRDPDRNLAMTVANQQSAQFWGEVLAEYGDGDPDSESKLWPGQEIG